MNRTTEFLAKSLLGAGVFLAVPAALVVIYSVFALIVSSWGSDRLSHAGLLHFCLLGFTLLILAFRIVRHPERARHPRVVWACSAFYLGAITGFGVWWLAATYNRARQENWASDNFDTGLLFFPGVLLLLPLYGFVLSALLCTRSQCA